MKTLVDEYGDPVKPWSLHMNRQGQFMTITDIGTEDETYPVGAVFEGGDPDEDGDYFPASYFNFEWVDR